MNGMNPRIANRATKAVAFLNASGIEIIRTDGGSIVRDADSGADGYELTCDSDAELVDVTRRVRALCANAPKEPVEGGGLVQGCVRWVWALFCGDNHGLVHSTG